MAFEKVHTVWKYHDGPRTGVAEFRGQPHHYECEFNELTDEYENIFFLSPIDEGTFALVIEQWQIFREWESKFTRGEVSQKSHPGIPGQHVRYQELENLLKDRIINFKQERIRAKGTFLPLSNQPQSLPGALRELVVEWAVVL